MNVFVDYYRHGGHKTRCEALSLALLEAGHTLTMIGPDVHVYDYPALWQGTPDWRAPVHIVMGRSPAVGEWAWYPLGPLGATIANGPEYLMLDPMLDMVPRPAMRSGTLLTMGSMDAVHNTELIMKCVQDRPMTVIVGPQFSRNLVARRDFITVSLPRQKFLGSLAASEFVICGWGQTVFEALYLGCKVLPIACGFGHTLEADRMGPYIYDTRRTIKLLQEGRESWYRDDTLDLKGAMRTVRWIEHIVEGDA